MALNVEKVGTAEKMVVQSTDINVIKKEVKKDLSVFKKIERYTYFGIKRTFDVTCALIGVIFLLPLIVLVKLSYLISKDTKSMFYTQTRIGKDGKVFKLYKFRSMVNNADEVLKELLKDPKYKKEWEEYQKFDNDPRITKMGNILRKTSLDELPQILNVLKGDMSFIGPRPLVVGELDSHNGNHKIYESVRPGISGWWASHGRSATTYEERLELEYYYCKNCSLWLDIKCFFATIAAVFKKTGAK